MPELSFVVDSALLSELGERLVESDHLALAELIKNAYDADATEVTVALKPDKKERSLIIVKDNGCGMTFTDVKNYWMRIATTNKADYDVSPKYGRPKTGSKGIGRFSCRRLGNKLQLNTTGRKKDKRYETTKVEFNWKDYRPGTEVANIICQGEKTVSREGKTGTTLIIQGGDYKRWNQKSWNALKRKMIVLVANRGIKRRGFKEDPGFNINLLTAEFEEEVVTNPHEQLMDAGWGRLKVRVEKDGSLICDLNAKKIGNRTITHKNKFKSLAGTQADIAILPDNRQQFRNTSVLSKTNLKQILDDWGGIFVRHRNTRVYPYGEIGNDWLGIDRDRGLRKLRSDSEILRQFTYRLRGVTPGRELLNMLSSHSYIGDIEVSSPNKELFDMKASREGFVGTSGISLLQKAMRFGIDWSTIYRDYYLRLIEKEKVETAREEFEEIIEKPIEPEKTVERAVEYVKQEIKQIAP